MLIKDCPKLDYLLLGGPDPNWALKDMSQALKDFIVKCTSDCKIIFTTCTGASVAASAGILDDTHATMNHMMIPAAKQIWPAVGWTDQEQWVVSKCKSKTGEDGSCELWTSGGACAGMDMFASWMMQEYGRDVTEFGLETLDLEPRGRKRGEWVWLTKHGEGKKGKEIQDGIWLKK